MAVKVEAVDFMRVKTQRFLEEFVSGVGGGLYFISYAQAEPFWLSLNHHNHGHQMLWNSYSAGGINKGPGSSGRCLHG